MITIAGHGDGFNIFRIDYRLKVDSYAHQKKKQRDSWKWDPRPKYGVYNQD